MGGTELQGGLATFRNRVRDKDGSRSGQARALYRSNANTAGTHDHYGRAFFNLGGVHHRTDTGLQGATDDTNCLQGHLRVYLDGTAHRCHHVLRQCTNPHTSHHLLAVSRQARGAVQEGIGHDVQGVDAEAVLVALAVVAAAAERGRR